MIDSGDRCPACTYPWLGLQSSVAGKEVRVCGRCGLWYSDPALLGDINYDLVYETEYKEEHFSSLDNTSDWSDFVKHPTYRNFFLEIPLKDDAILLDVGCGVGRFCRAAYSKGWKVKGIDISTVAVAKGQQTAPFPMLNITLEDLAETGEKFDAVTAFEVLEHITEPYEFLSTIKQVMKQGGHFFCTVPNLDCGSVKSATRKDWIPPVHVLFFTENALRELLLRSGFHDIRTGVIWANEPPKSFGTGLMRYYMNRFLNNAPVPDPLGLWACCEL